MTEPWEPQVIRIECPTCLGRGIYHGNGQDCQRCDASGHILVVPLVRHEEEVGRLGRLMSANHDMLNKLEKFRELASTYAARYVYIEEIDGWISEVMECRDATTDIRGILNEGDNDD